MLLPVPKKKQQKTQIVNTRKVEQCKQDGCYYNVPCPPPPTQKRKKERKKERKERQMLTVLCQLQTQWN